MSAILTPKQEGFCRSYLEIGNASEAYRLHYDAVRMNSDSVNRQAKAMLDNPKIATRIEILKSEHGKRHNVTVDDIIAELEEARQLAIRTDKAGPAVQASMGKARLYGFDKQILDHMSSDGSMRPAAPIYNIIKK